MDHVLLKKSFQCEALLVLLVSVILPNVLCSQEVVDFEFDTANRSAFIISPDSCLPRSDVLNAIAEQLQMTFSVSENGTQTWKGEKTISRPFFYSFRGFNLTAQEPITVKSTRGDFSLKVGEALCVIGFTGNLKENKKVDRNFSEFLLSVYRQHTDHVYASYPYNFAEMPELSLATFNKRNWLSMGYGLSYLTKDNPFSARNTGAIVGLYIFEALHYAAIIGGPLSGQSTSETILLPVTALLSLIFWKGVAMRHMIAPPILNMNERMVKSGFQLPHTLKSKDEDWYYE